MASTTLQPCSDLSDILPLNVAYSLYLKPIARVLIAVQLPKSLATTSTRPGAAVGKTISNWEVMEKLKHLAKPFIFSMMKVTTSTLEVIRYEGEVDNKDTMLKVIHALEDQTIKLSGFSEVLKVTCVEAKLSFPQRHDWTAFFRDAKNLNELRPGERPDTVLLQMLPCKWFAVKNPENSSTTSIPSEIVVREVFETFGKLRAVDIPILDPSRNSVGGTNSSAGGLVSFGHELVFETYIQFAEYNGFVKCLTALYGTKLLRQETEDKSHTASFKVDFDKSLHMADKNIRKRRQERATYRRLQTEREEKLKAEAEQMEHQRKLEEQRVADEAQKMEEKRLRREERRRQRRALEEQKKERRRKREEERVRQLEVALEERKLLIAQRQLESIRLLSAVFDRLKEKREMGIAELERIRAEEEERRRKEEARQQEINKEIEFRQMLDRKEQELRTLLLKTKRREERKDRKSVKKLRKQKNFDSSKTTISDQKNAPPPIQIPQQKPEEILQQFLPPDRDMRPPVKSIHQRLSPKKLTGSQESSSQDRKLNSLIVAMPSSSSASGADKADVAKPLYEIPKNVLYC